MLRTVALFVLAALGEIGGAYLVWQWARVGRNLAFALAGAGLLFAYAFTQTTQPFNFGRAFAAYGGVFITVALLWGWLVDGHVPDRWDWIGVAICLAGAAVILWMPRR
jgi:small multidrug resistance family-3 protein